MLHATCYMFIFTELYMFQGLIQTVAILVMAMMLWSFRWIKSFIQLHFHDQYQTDTKLRINHFQRRISLAINIYQKIEPNKQAIKSKFAARLAAKEIQHISRIFSSILKFYWLIIAVLFPCENTSWIISKYGIVETEYWNFHFRKITVTITLTTLK